MSNRSIESKAKRIAGSIRRIVETTRVVGQDSGETLTKLSRARRSLQLSMILKKIDRELAPRSNDRRMQLHENVQRNLVIQRVGELLDLDDDTFLGELIKESNNKQHIEFSRQIGKLISKVEKGKQPKSKS